MGTDILPLTFPVMAICDLLCLTQPASTPAVNLNARFTRHFMVWTLVHDELGCHEGYWTAAGCNEFQLLPVWREF